MAISQTTITGSFRNAKGLPAPITAVTFTLKGSDYEDGELIVLQPVQAEIIDPEAGTFIATVWPNDRGVLGGTTYSVAFKFEDESKVAAIDGLHIQYSETPVSLEEIAIRTRLAGAVKPRGLQLIRRSAYEALPALDPNTVYLIMEG